MTFAKPPRERPVTRNEWREHYTLARCEQWASQDIADEKQCQCKPCLAKHGANRLSRLEAVAEAAREVAPLFSPMTTHHAVRLRDLEQALDALAEVEK